jgi:hypothetical protein
MPNAPRIVIIEEPLVKSAYNLALCIVDQNHAGVARRYICGIIGRHLIRFAQNEAPSLVISAWRMSIAAVIMGGVVLFRHRAEISRVKGGQLGLIILTGVILALHFASWVTSLE